SFACFIKQLDMFFKEKEVLIELSLLGSFYSPYWMSYDDVTIFIKGYCTELFCIIACSSKKKFEGVLLFKLDMTSLKSEDIKIFKGFDMSVKSWEDEEFDVISISKKLWKKLEDLEEAIFFLILVMMTWPGIASELGGYIHIRDRTLEDDHEGTNCALDIKQKEKGIAVRSVTDNENELNDWN
nr:cation/H+ exchanger, cation/H+ exchanger, CPA1 family [Tanacetum cinerariifolium]